MEWMSKTYGIADLPLLAKELAQIIEPYKVVTFTGNLGAGKTTLVKILCQLWGVDETVSSPTFSLVNQYTCNHPVIGNCIYHIDLYRVKNAEEAYGAGVEDNLYSGDLCLVEWPEKAMEIIPKDALRVEISGLDHEQRHIRVVSGEN
jgi:tRNA threonylcarbamoyladenosine biosynthesis protein TsaE